MLDFLGVLFILEIKMLKVPGRNAIHAGCHYIFYSRERLQKFYCPNNKGNFTRGSS